MLLESKDCLCLCARDADGVQRLTFNAISTTQGLPFCVVERLAAWAVRIATCPPEAERSINWRHLIRDSVPDPMLAVIDRARREFPEV